MKDNVYFDLKYAQLYEKQEYGVADKFEISCDEGKISHTFIKREIPELLWNGCKTYDIRTPYGYGGPRIIKADNEEALIKKYESEFKMYCEDNNIISEFIRFFPINNNAYAFREVYDIEFNRKTVITDLTLGDDIVSKEFSKGCRKKIRQAFSKGLTYEIEPNPRRLDDFVEIYYSTMDRNSASDYYYFGDEYFANLLSNFGDRLLVIYVIYNNIKIAAGLYFICDEGIDIHLSGTLKDYLKLSPAYVLRYAVVEWAVKNNTMTYIHHGGGKTELEDDSLFAFKKQFGQSKEGEFYIAEKEWNKEACYELKKRLNFHENINSYIRGYHE